MITKTPISSPNPLRDIITKHYRMDEAKCIASLLAAAALPADTRTRIINRAIIMAEASRAYKKKLGKIDNLIHKYNLSTEEGIALMCLAEALLRIPDKATQDKFISDKLSSAAWGKHLDREQPLFINAATWSLMLTGKMYAPVGDETDSLWSALKRMGSRLSIPLIRPIIMQMMKTIGKQFVIGEDIHSALKNSATLEKQGYLFSYDMLGEAARTHEEAENYFNAYANAIKAVGAHGNGDGFYKNPNVSVKLSALHPRYEFAQHDTVMRDVPTKLLALAELAKENNISLIVDAEEADRLDLSLDIFTQVFHDSALNDWEGLGLAVQAYQKRAYPLIDWIIALAMEKQKRIPVRLVKGAYWDAEIKMTQVLGLENYPVFTRKHGTDVSYLACAKKMLAHVDTIYPQFGTHNAYSLSAVIEVAKDQFGDHLPDEAFEFQGLYGMLRPLFDQIVSQGIIPCRIYAPVGNHQDLLGYLVRRLLENGANNSFLRMLTDEHYAIEELIVDPAARLMRLPSAAHPKIPLPKDIYEHWQNSTGLDLSDCDTLATLKKELDAAKKTYFPKNGPRAIESLTAKSPLNQEEHRLLCPADTTFTTSLVGQATLETLTDAITAADQARQKWEQLGLHRRAEILEKAADQFQKAMPRLMTILSIEGGKCIPDCISEIRETIEYCRYYAYCARTDLKPIDLPSVTGEANQLRQHPRGVFACISPWNFPLAIFTGQIVACLVAGNCVIAKPSEQTPLIAHTAVKILHDSGVPTDVLQLVMGPGSVIGANLVKDERVTGVMFTGSTETAKSIERSLAAKKNGITTFVAETGGQNAMIVDSSALPEQTIIDVIQSAFNSAGQRCSALRVLFVQEEIAPRMINLLKGYMAEIKLGDPNLLATDVGPVIDEDALKMLTAHADRMAKEGQLIARVPLIHPLPGHFFAPCAFEIDDLKRLTGEVFGPILHVIRYQSHFLDKVLDAIINTGYGLTLGVESRIDATVNYITNCMPVGNMYVNRNMIGAVVGSQPFGGERLSGTGPKAGGPHYLPRLCVERTISVNTTAVGGNARLVSLLEED